ncbi:hypothetical protein [Candidatus Tisiphia endosymbiont of Nedyus quadrimaculatus]|uniref:hypothetical protein n=1 Tax=Candidatus Tisiphia endosymbiont of Nedyus quadrimaculatus TaxID=3139332 RepID=UPI00345EB2D0
MSGYQYVYPSETVCRMEFLLKSASDMIAFRKIQCIYLRAKFSYLPKQISEITGLSISRVRRATKEMLLKYQLKLGMY